VRALRHKRANDEGGVKCSRRRKSRDSMMKRTTRRGGRVRCTLHKERVRDGASPCVLRHRKAERERAEE